MKEVFVITQQSEKEHYVLISSGYINEETRETTITSEEKIFYNGGWTTYIDSAVHYDSYEEAKTKLLTLPKGYYQIEKYFVI